MPFQTRTSDPKAKPATNPASVFTTNCAVACNAINRAIAQASRITFRMPLQQSVASNTA
jgi:hypothetical protein